MMASGESGLRRDIGFTGSAFLSFNGVVGAGIFALPETLYTQFGAFSPFLFPLFGLLVLIVALPFARTASHYQVSGGPVVYAASFGQVAAFQAGWLYYIARATALAANANVLVAYLASYWPWLGEGFGRGTVILVALASITAVNIVGVKSALRLLDILTLGKAGPLVVAALFGLVVAGASIEAPSGVPPLDEMEAAALLVLYAFIGFENSVVPAGETRDAARNIPRALIATLAATALLYFLIQLAYVAVMAPGEGGAAPLAAFGAKLWGPAGALLLSAAAIFSLLGNISGGITGTSRTTYALGRDRLLPVWFGRVHPRHATPANSILVMGALIAVLALTGSFVWLAVISTLARLIVYAIGIVALPKAERPSPLWWGLIAAGLGICLWAGLQSAWPSWRMLIILVAAGTVLYGVARRQAASSSAETVSEIQPPPSTRSPS
ncbi:MAG TPA: APC family permease [Allosphingosinicella sp.]|nr:APC family permease [Allosphingosinicella sp.]